MQVSTSHPDSKSFALKRVRSPFATRGLSDVTVGESLWETNSRAAVLRPLSLRIPEGGRVRAQAARPSLQLLTRGSRPELQNPLL